MSLSTTLIPEFLHEKSEEGRNRVFSKILTIGILHPYFAPIILLTQPLQRSQWLLWTEPVVDQKYMGVFYYNFLSYFFCFTFPFHHMIEWRYQEKGEYRADYLKILLMPNTSTTMFLGSFETWNLVGKTKPLVMKESIIQTKLFILV